MSIIGSILGSLFSWVMSKLFGGSQKNDDIELGEKRQQVADAKADIDVIHRANVAAKKAEERPNVVDVNDLDARR